MSQIVNNATLDYQFDSEDYEETACAYVDKTPSVKPDVLMTKTASVASAKKGDTITYYVTITVGAGDDDFGTVTFADVVDEATEFLEGTLKLDGVVLEDQSLDAVALELHPSTVYQLEYQCVRTN